MLPNLTIVETCHSKRDLEIIEALLIKQHKPIINVQVRDFDRTLKVF